jgi:hypothetical protein
MILAFSHNFLIKCAEESCSFVVFVVFFKYTLLYGDLEFSTPVCLFLLTRSGLRWSANRCLLVAMHEQGRTL